MLLIIFPSIARANVQLNALKVTGEKKVAVIRSQWKDKNMITYDTLLSFLSYHLPTLSLLPPVFSSGDFLMWFSYLVARAVQSPFQCMDVSSFVLFFPWTYLNSLHPLIKQVTSYLLGKNCLFLAWTGLFLAHANAFCFLCCKKVLLCI